MLTVFTSAHNRRNTMERLYSSLKKQTSYNFEWLIIDNASIDGLEEDVNIWMSENTLFPIRYYRVGDIGKQKSINYAVQKLDVCEHIFIVDDDDCLACHAIAFIEEKLLEIKDDRSFAGIAFPYYSYPDGRRVGTFPESVEYVDGFAYNRHKLGLRGDTCDVFKRDILKAYPFPEYEGENIMPEGTAWDLIGLDGYKVRFYDEKLYFNEYLKEGSSRNIVRDLIKNPRGWAASIRTQKKCNDPDIYRRQYMYIICMCEKFNREELCEMLEISIKEYEEYESAQNFFCSKIKNLLKENNISSIALYGFGINARYFLIHLKKIGKDIEYGIDQKPQCVNYDPIYSLEMELPEVDCVFITMANISKETKDSIKTAIKQKLPNTHVWSLCDIDSRIWSISSGRLLSL